MHAIIRTGGKQYRVREGDSLNIERLLDDNQNPRPLGETVVFTVVLALGDGAAIKLGKPTVAGATVSATVVAQARAKKVIIFKIRRRKNSQRRRGHRQYFTRIRITSIAG
jgi:large subunit ribosomal protein L21